MTTRTDPADRDGVSVGGSLVERLIAAQFPRWAGLPVREVRSSGTDNAMHRLGGDMVVRLPRTADAAGQVAAEQRWLPHLAPHLPLEVPMPLGAGVPGEGYGHSWSVYRWIDGENLFDRPLSGGGLLDAAAGLGRFLAALHRVDTAGAPRSSRGGPPGTADDEVRAAIRDLGADGRHDAEAATAAWEAALRAPRWQGAPVWLHGDLLPGNLLGRGGRLTAVIDFGLVGTGDPACDVMAAWTLLTAASRGAFREAAGVDEATWARGRGWALRFGLTAEHYYRGGRNPVLAAIGHRAAAEAVADHHCG
ncbi:aminoglycoside phosphotransferase family protein [Streptomyces sp. NPDC051784]|uniref:aminoglycoside phosphotransferase family protein n=1 Tax=Streptomyces sp. NPDC051784 TaxID=3155805 RepID=UPI00341A0A22